MREVSIKLKTTENLLAEFKKIALGSLCNLSEDAIATLVSSEFLQKTPLVSSGVLEKTPLVLSEVKAQLMRLVFAAADKENQIMDKVNSHSFRV